MSTDNSPSKIPVDKNGLVILSGSSIKVSVRHDGLHLEDHAGAVHRASDFDRATCGIKRLVILSSCGGYLSLDALQWLQDIGAAVMVIGYDERVLMTGAGRQLDHPALRRAQALAVYTGSGLTVARALIREKLAGQRRNLDRFGGPSPVFEDACARVERCQTTDALRAAEAQAAGAYWSAWSDVPVRFARRDIQRIPAHWLTFGARASAVTGHPRSATNPANAVLNYAYAILQGETLIALTAYGMDAGLGVMHADDRNKSGLAFDVMEAARPAVDAWFLDLLAQRVFTREEVYQTATGVVRLALPLRRESTGASMRFAQAIVPHVEKVAEMFLDAELPAKLTLRRKRIRPVKRAVVRPAETRCIECGVEIGPHRQYCDACFANYLPGSITNAHAALAEQRAQGIDTAHSPQANRQRGEKNAAHYRANAEFVEPGDLDYARDIAPHLQQFSAREIARATGLSVSYASFIRSGRRTPHARHWAGLAALVRAGEQG